MSSRTRRFLFREDLVRRIFGVYLYIRSAFDGTVSVCGCFFVSRRTRLLFIRNEILEFISIFGFVQDEWLFVSSRTRCFLSQRNFRVYPYVRCVWNVRFFVSRGMRLFSFKTKF